MENSDVKDSYILNENYMLKYDKKRFILTNRHSHDIYLDKNAEDFPESVNTIIHPLLALLFSLFDGYRSKEDIIVEYSKILKISTDVVRKFVDDLFIEVLAEKEKKFIKFENRLFFIPHNLFLKNKYGKKSYTHYNINNFMIHKDDLDLKSFRHYYPLDCMLEVNFTCYTDCIYCYADRRNRDKFTISIDRVKEIIKEAKELGMRTIDTCGGELFLYENWEILIKELIDTGFKPYISTKIPISINEIKKLKNVGQKEMQLSIDSINGDELKKILKVDSNYIEKIKKTLKHLEKEEMDVFINSQITNINDNPEHIKNMLEYFLTFNNIKRIKIGHIGKSLYLKTNLYNNISSSLDNIKKIKDIVESYKDKYTDTDISFSGYAIKDRYISDDIKIKGDNYRNRVKCSANFYAFVILPNGKVTICEELYFHPAFIIGDIKKQSIMEIWNSERALELYRLPQEKLRDESACKTCKKEEYEICRQKKGVCWKEILMAYNYKNWDYPDPKCPHAPMPFNRFWLE